MPLRPTFPPVYWRSDGFSSRTLTAFFAVCALLTIILAMTTVWCTGMIYACLTTVKAWDHPLVAPIYCALALLTGGVLFNVLVALWFGAEKGALWVGLAMVLTAWLMKVVYWSQVDTEPKTATPGDATGLGRFGTVSVLEPPHTQANFVMREMGFEVARKHAEKLRAIATACLFVVPALGLLVLLVASTTAATLVGLIVLISMAAGVLVERWLFFGEAKHIVMLYYGEDAI